MNSLAALMGESDRMKWAENRKARNSTRSANEHPVSWVCGMSVVFFGALLCRVPSGCVPAKGSQVVSSQNSRPNFRRSIRTQDDTLSLILRSRCQIFLARIGGQLRRTAQHLCSRVASCNDELRTE